MAQALRDEAMYYLTREVTRLFDNKRPVKKSRLGDKASVSVPFSAPVDQGSMDSVRLDLNGLSQHEARRRLLKYGPNELEARKKRSPVVLFLEQFNDLMIWLLSAATLISAYMGEVADAVTILIIVVMNAVLGFIQESKTERSLEELKRLASPKARVIRDGKQLVIPSAELVCGDLIVLRAGDIIPADGLILTAVQLECDEAILTGESHPVGKMAYSGDRNGSGSGSGSRKEQAVHRVYMGCSITRGHSICRVVAIGMNTDMGRIAGMLGKIREELTPLQQKLKELGKILVYSCILICAAVAFTGIVKGEEPYKMFLVGVSLAVAAIPEGLPAIVTISLALGMQRMIKKNVLIRKLPAVETLGCTQIICADKTGTLTQNKMTVKELVLYNQTYLVDEVGIHAAGSTAVLPIDGSERNSIVTGQSLPNNGMQSLWLMGESFFLCSSAFGQDNDGESDTYVDPTEQALLSAALKIGVTRQKLMGRYSLLAENPFDSGRKMMSMLYQNGAIQTLFVKGAPEYVLKKCSSYLINGRETPLSAYDRIKIVHKMEEMASASLRVIACAYRRGVGSLSARREEELVFIGMAGMMDPPKKDAAEAIVNCKLAGITPVMITGDNLKTAAAIAQKLHMLEEDSLLLSGDELDSMAEEELIQVLPRVRVFARVNPGHKHRIIKGFKRLGYIAAMTGDGVNDAPAIKEADIGISMGISGTGVTKEAAAMILLDDSFSSIVTAVREGRVIYDNIRKFIRYLLSCNLGEVLTMFLASLLNLPLPLLPIQILLINLATDGLPAMALSLEPPEDDVMQKKPRGRKEGLFSEGLWAKILLRGSMIGLCTILSFVLVLHFSDENIKLSRTVALCTLILSQLFHVFECRSERSTIWRLGIWTNRYLIYAVLSSLVLLLMVVYIPQLQFIFETCSLRLTEWSIVFCLSSIITVISSFVWNKK